MKVAFIGGGKMAEAMVGACIRTRVAKPPELFVIDVSEERRTLLKTRFGINTYKDMVRLPDMASTLVLAVKPQDLPAVLETLRPLVGKKTLIISIAAGKRIAWLEDQLPDCRVVRVMPNLACLVGESMSVYAFGSRTRAEDRKTVERLLGSFGKVIELPERHMDAVTAMSGSGPAFFAHFTDLLAAAGEAEGLDRDTSRLLAVQTMLGTARLLIEHQIDPRELISSVSSARGTTAAGMQVLAESPMATIVREVIHAAAERSRELSA